LSHYQTQTIDKPQGKRTPSCTIRFDELHQYFKVYKEVVDIDSPTTAVAAWVESGHTEENALQVLYSVIVRFGGGHRIWGKYHQSYAATISDVNATLVQAYQKRTDSVAALRAVLVQIKGLGGLSYGTKMLRFLNPNHVVLDSILREELCLQETDYETFAAHCRQIAQILSIQPVDVESALFAFVQVKNPNQRKARWKQYQSL
jgi:hypothetical protein